MLLGVLKELCNVMDIKSDYMEQRDCTKPHGECSLCPHWHQLTNTVWLEETCRM